MKKEQGYTLVFVLVTIAVVSTLALTVIGMNLQTKKATEIRKTETNLSYEARSLLNEAVAHVANTFPANEAIGADSKLFEMRLEQLTRTSVTDPVDITRNAFNSQLVRDGQSIGRYWYDIIEGDSPYVKILQVTAEVASTAANQPVQERTYTQRLSLSTLPSFLYHVLGSEGQLTINGAPAIKGNIYSNMPVRVSKAPLYTYKGQTNPQVWSEKAAVDGTITLGNRDATSLVKSVTVCPSVCLETTPPSAWRIPLADEKVFANQEKTRFNAAPESFASLDYRYSLLEYLNREKINLAPQNVSDSDGTLNLTKLRTQLAGSAQLAKRTVDKVTVFDKDLGLLSATQARMIINNSFFPIKAVLMDTDISESPHPLVVDGDLSIQSVRPADDPLLIMRPLIVLGNLSISGNVSFDTTIFTLGRTTIDDANIKAITTGGRKNTVVLLSKEEILINRLDQFTSTQRDDSHVIEAFLYSDSANLNRVYAVGSNVTIDGGLFSRGPLMVNAFRGDFSQSTPPADLASFQAAMIQSNGIEHSRLKINYDASVIKNRQQTLPVTNRVHLYVEAPKRQLR